MPVYDCFTFFNELDLLEIRLNELSSVVDTFVIAEAPVTFQGKPKPLYFQGNRARFSRFDKQIRHIIVEDMPTTNNPWEREHHQRNALKKGLTDAAPDAAVIISDVDEILTPAAILEIKERKDFTYVQMKLAVYFLNCEVTGGPDIPWIKVYGAPWQQIQGISNLTDPRNGQPGDYLKSQNMGDLDKHLVLKGGWHFSWLGSPERLIQKLDAFSHTEEKLQQWRNPEHLARSIAQKRFFTSGSSLSIRPVKEMPMTIQKAKERYLQEAMLAPEQRKSLLARLVPSELDGAYTPAQSDDLVLIFIFYKKRLKDYVKKSRWLYPVRWLWRFISRLTA